MSSSIRFTRRLLPVRYLPWNKFANVRIRVNFLHKVTV